MSSSWAVRSGGRKERKKKRKIFNFNILWEGQYKTRGPKKQQKNTNVAAVVDESSRVALEGGVDDPVLVDAKHVCADGAAVIVPATAKKIGHGQGKKKEEEKEKKKARDSPQLFFCVAWRHLRLASVTESGAYLLACVLNDHLLTRDQTLQCPPPNTEGKKNQKLDCTSQSSPPVSSRLREGRPWRRGPSHGSRTDPSAPCPSAPEKKKKLKK